MNRVKLLILTVAFLLPFALQAGEANKTDKNVSAKKVVNHESNSSDRVAKAKELFDTMHVKKIYAKIVDNATDSIVSRMPKLKGIRGKIHAFYEKYIGWNALKDDMAKIYAKYYSEKDLEGLIKFYKSDLGQKTLKVQANVTQEGRLLGLRRVTKHQNELKELVDKALKPPKK